MMVVCSLKLFEGRGKRRGLGPFWVSRTHELQKLIESGLKLAFIRRCRRRE